MELGLPTESVINPIFRPWKRMGTAVMMREAAFPTFTRAAPMVMAISIPSPVFSGVP